MDFTDLESARQQEAERRLKLLGTCTRDDCTDRQLRDRSAETFVAPPYLADWKHKYRLYGIDGLRPSHWAPLDKPMQCIVRSRFKQLGALGAL